MKLKWDPIRLKKNRTSGMREKTAEEVKHGEAFVLTNNPCIHVMRVRSCVKAGGHDVPEGKMSAVMKNICAICPG